ncbi:unnamed protein product [Bursaphelenchus okinawaensis]|uniref:Uncharacterized protein n=1 Tax=Bursaphelenchus okinawaensis TaxID=465554 RepID=A0A811JWA0_9BILA|nr:unnamed protein product [Bursaphelenchus okinawaensis]CAG9085250.1 unnamed protein product [Bursaphelenchus okinawaensis]
MELRQIRAETDEKCQTQKLIANYYRLNISAPFVYIYDFFVKQNGTIVRNPQKLRELFYKVMASDWKLEKYVSRTVFDEQHTIYSMDQLPFVTKAFKFGSMTVTIEEKGRLEKKRDGSLRPEHVGLYQAVLTNRLRHDSSHFGKAPYGGVRLLPQRFSPRQEVKYG